MSEPVSAFSAYQKKIKTKKSIKKSTNSFNSNFTTLNKVKKQGPKIKLNKKRKIEIDSNQVTVRDNAPLKKIKKKKTKKLKDGKCIVNKKLQIDQLEIPRNNSVEIEVEKNSFEIKEKSEISSHSPLKIKTVEPKNNSIEDGKNILKWLINPIAVNEFMNEFWEKSPCLIKRKNLSYYTDLISFAAIDKMLLDNHVEFTKNIDVTSYKDGVRETLNPEGRAYPGNIWEKYAEGCSIRLLNPQTFLSPILKLNSTLQEYFHCLVGANVYLTPPNSQGFAPHYDDIEAFVLQIEGRKKWKLYNPRTKYEELPRFSSTNFNENQIGKPILEKVLHPGDMLYFPRGTIHQACTEPGYHSLHITLSVYQRQSYADLFEKMVPMLLNQIIEDDVEIRRGLPLSVWSNFGLVHSSVKSSERYNVIQNCKELLKKAIYRFPIDDAVDQLAKKYMHEALPPCLNIAEKERTVFGSKNILNENGEAVASYDFNLQTRIRLLRANILRLVHEDNAFKIYYYGDNSKQYQEYEPNFIEISQEEAKSVEIIVKSYPDYTIVKNLPLENDEQKICFAQGLWERGILMMAEVV